MLTRPFLLVAAAACLAVSARAQRVQDIQADRSIAANVLNRRQSNDDDFEYDEDSVCYSYGIDFQNGGSYFIDSRITESFTVVSQFEHCVPDTSAYVLLVNNETGDQVECTGVPTTPALTNQMSTCPIAKSEMTSGSWSVLVIGNNGDGSPFGWQRDFTLTVGVPTTSTTTSTVTYTETTTPITTVQTTSTIKTTTSVPNKSTITIPAATRTITVTPKAKTITSTKWLTRTINRWTKTQVKITKTVVPTCTVPPRPGQHDPKCRILPTIIPIPKGLTITVSKGKRTDSLIPIENLRKRIESSQALKARLAREAELAKRSPDAPTVYVQAPDVVNATTTVTAPVLTVSEVQLTTFTATITDPPQTVKSGTKTISTTLPAKTKTITKIGYTTVTTTRTMAVTWTYTTKVKPTASVSACKKQGGHFDLL
ncbi:hypothetical protein Slin15195_G107240 [Septoria linicola]|uniref:Uncharacterized protein n=1 Tax=Septoria linicola TaxID=215465 RepID=A0A9Q9ENU0_9PEZI|nr:hypothetical protein Slin14017_G070190 [Septoria linicola]USW57405.1 hypothetical protein Slin15195_G107240 [Septoria linicola]